MKTLEEIKQERAYEMDYSDWEEFIYGVDDPNILDMEFDEVANRFAREVAREALKNASESAKTFDANEGKCGGFLPPVLWIDKQSILNEKNIPEL